MASPLGEDMLRAIMATVRKAFTDDHDDSRVEQLFRDRYQVGGQLLITEAGEGDVSETPATADPERNVHARNETFAFGDPGSEKVRNLNPLHHASNSMHSIL